MTEVSVNSTLVTSAALSACVMNGMCRWSRGTRNKRECPPAINSSGLLTARSIHRRSKQTKRFANPRREAYAERHVCAHACCVCARARACVRAHLRCVHVRARVSCCMRNSRTYSFACACAPWLCMRTVGRQTARQGPLCSSAQIASRLSTVSAAGSSSASARPCSSRWRRSQIPSPPSTRSRISIAERRWRGVGAALARRVRGVAN
jgi:hypothetical protein